MVTESHLAGLLTHIKEEIAQQEAADQADAAILDGLQQRIEAGLAEMQQFVTEAAQFFTLTSGQVPISHAPGNGNGHLGDQPQAGALDMETVTENELTAAAVEAGEPSKAEAPELDALPQPGYFKWSLSQAYEVVA